MTVRALWWVQSFYPSIGGVEVMGGQLARALKARGHDIVVVASDEESLPPRGSFHGIEIRRYPFFRALRMNDFGLIQGVRESVLELVDDFRPDLVHLHCLSYSAWFCQRMLRRRSLPLLTTLHHLFAGFTVSDRSIPLRVLERSDRIACCSEAVLEDVREQLPSFIGRASVVLNGLAPPALPPTPPPVGPPRLLCLGRAVEQKGFDLAIDAFARIAGDYPGARLVIAGDGEALPQLRERVARLGMESAAEFTGWLAPEAVPAAIAASTAVVIPSRAEGFCLVALEAAYMARPVVATRVGGLPEVVVDGVTGLLVEPEDPAALARALVTLLNDPEAADRLGRAARTRALEAFGGDRCLREYEALYLSLSQTHSSIRN